MNLQPAVKKEASFIAISTFAATAAMLVLFFIGNRFMPEAIPFGVKVIISGLLGAAVSSGNFFFMAITVQKVTNAETDDEAYDTMKLSFRYRTMIQLVWGALALILPFLNGAAGIIPLFFPSFAIKIRGILGIG